MPVLYDALIFASSFYMDVVGYYVALKPGGKVQGFVPIRTVVFCHVLIVDDFSVSRPLAHGQSRAYSCRDTVPSFAS